MSRPRFTLRAILIATAIACLWCGYSLVWIQERRAAINSDGMLIGKMTISEWMAQNGPIRAPALLWLFGEKGYFQLVIEDRDDSEARRDQLSKPSLKRGFCKLTTHDNFAHTRGLARGEGGVRDLRPPSPGLD
jgi:hypothetical protein